MSRGAEPGLLHQLVEIYRTHAPDISLTPDSATAIQSCGNAGIGLAVITDGPFASQQAKVLALGLSGGFSPSSSLLATVTDLPSRIVAHLTLLSKPLDVTRPSMSTSPTIPKRTSLRRSCLAGRRYAYAEPGRFAKRSRLQTASAPNCPIFAVFHQFLGSRS